MVREKDERDPTRPAVTLTMDDAGAPRRRLSLPTPWRLPRPVLARLGHEPSVARMGGPPAIGTYDHHAETDEADVVASAVDGELDAEELIGEAAFLDDDDDDSPAPEPEELDVFEDPAAAPAPEPVLELAASCVRFVVVALSIEPDLTPETLPIVDHYLEQARRSVRERPESKPLVAQSVGAYLGEVVRRTHACWWRTDAADPLAWRLDFRDVFLSFYPLELAWALLTEPEGDFSGLELRDTFDREAVLGRLHNLPAVSEEEYRTASTRLELLDIAVDALSRRRLRDKSARRVYRPGDYG